LGTLKIHPLATKQRQRCGFGVGRSLVPGCAAAISRSSIERSSRIRPRREEETMRCLGVVGTTARGRRCASRRPALGDYSSLRTVRWRGRDRCRESRRRRSRLSARMRQRRADCRHATHDACLHEPACRMASLLGSERWRLSGRRRNRRIMLPFATPSRSIEGSNLPPRTSLPARIAHGVRLALARLRPRPHEKTRRRDLPGRHGSRWTEEGGTTAPPCSPAWTTP
jgi:hypothetical protein